MFVTRKKNKIDSETRFLMVKILAIFSSICFEEEKEEETKVLGYYQLNFK